jgi:hypothetical protein
MKKSTRNFFVYLFVFIGYLLFYVYDVESLIYPNDHKEVKSKVSFVYEQF